MGNGSNLLSSGDGGIRGVAIKVNEGFNKIKVDETRFIVKGSLIIHY